MTQAFWYQWEVEVSSVEDWHRLMRDSARLTKLVGPFLEALGISGTPWSWVGAGSCINIRTEAGFLKIFSPFNIGQAILQ